MRSRKEERLLGGPEKEKGDLVRFIQGQRIEMLDVFRSFQVRATWSGAISELARAWPTTWTGEDEEWTSVGKKLCAAAFARVQQEDDPSASSAAWEAALAVADARKVSRWCARSPRWLSSSPHSIPFSRP